MSEPVEISLPEFNAKSSCEFRHPIAAQMMEERRWFRSEVSTIVGFVGKDKTDEDFWAMVFGPDAQGKLGAILWDSNIATEEQAVQRLKKLFAQQEKTGVTVFSHD